MNPICKNIPCTVATENAAKGQEEKGKTVNLRYLEAMSENNAEFIGAMLKTFRDDSILFVLEMEEHLATRDFLAIQLAAHKMKPAGVYIGSNYFSLLMDLLEHAALRVNEARVVSLFAEIKNMIQSIRAEIDEYFTTTRLHTTDSTHL
jgi:hypothetical protein